MSIINFGTRGVSSNEWGEIMRESLVRFTANGWKLVGRDCSQYEKNTGYCATSFATATRILADQCLRKSGGHRNGFKNAVMARKTIEDAWFSEKNPQIIFEVDFYGTLHSDATAYGIALETGPWEEWRNRFCSQYGNHIHRQAHRHSWLYLNEDTVEISAMYVSNSEETVALLHRHKMQYLKPLRRRR